MNKIWTTFFTVLFSNKFFHERCSSERRTSYARCGRIPSQNLVTQPGFNLLLEITGMFAYYVDWTKQFSCKIYPLKMQPISSFTKGCCCQYHRKDLLMLHYYLLLQVFNCTFHWRVPFQSIFHAKSRWPSCWFPF